MNRRLVHALAVVVSLAPAIALGLGLGDIRLHSALNQALDAEIDLLSATEDEVISIRVRLATNEQFDRYGIDRIAALGALKFDIVKRTDGSSFIRVTSTEPMREPFLTFLVEASWPRGRLLREYTLLLDPPVLASAYQAPEDSVASAAQTGQFEEPASAGSEPELRATVVPSEPSVVPVIATPAAAAPEASSSVEAPAVDAEAMPAGEGMASSHGPVRRGETLWGIATRLRPDQAITINQMMIALYRANPDAFRGNINRLRTGAILRIPDAAEISGLAVAEANAEAVRHNDEWQSTRIAATSATTAITEPALPQLEPAPVAPAVAAQPEPSIVQQPIPAVSEPAAQPAPIVSAPAAATVAPSLSIVAPADEVGAPSTDPAARVAELEKQLEEAKAAGTGTKRKRDKIARLENELAEARSALTIASDTLSQIQQQAAAPATVAALTPATVPAMVPATAPATIATAESVVASPPSKPKKSALDSILENLFNPIVLTLLVGVPLLGAAGFVGLKKFKSHQAMKSAAQMDVGDWGEVEPEGDKTVVGGDEPTMQASPRGARGSEQPTVMRGPDPALLAPTGETVAIPDSMVEKTLMLPRAELDQTIMQTMAVETPASRRAEVAVEAPVPHNETVVGGTPLKLDENDPMSEADFHMAYGLYDQAADLIKKASQREPARRDLRLKLLEIYFSAGNKSAFVSEARALRETMGPRPDSDWNNVVIFGKQIAPEEGMFNEKASATSVVDFDASAGAGGAAPALDMMFEDFGAPAAAAPTAAAPPPAAAPAPAADAPLEFDLGDFQLDTGGKSEPTPAAAPAPKGKGNTDSQSDFDKALAELSAFVDTNVPKELSVESPTGGAAELDLANLELDDSGIEVESDSASETDTKLDLARAYIDMGDPGSAKGILEEVLADGDEKQKAEAQKLLKQVT